MGVEALLLGGGGLGVVLLEGGSGFGVVVRGMWAAGGWGIGFGLPFRVLIVWEVVAEVVLSFKCTGGVLLRYPSYLNPIGVGCLNSPSDPCVSALSSCDDSIDSCLWGV